jgi:hypothetical protein
VRSIHVVWLGSERQRQPIEQRQQFGQWAYVERRQFEQRGGVEQRQQFGQWAYVER